MAILFYLFWIPVVLFSTLVAFSITQAAGVIVLAGWVAFWVYVYTN